MPKYVSFLRAINVGGHTVKMDYLRSLFQAMGFSNVETFIASGNVVFDSPSKNAKALEKKIEDYLRETLGYTVATFIRSTSELANVAQYKPFKATELNAPGHTLYIGFVADRPAGSSKRKLLSLIIETDDLHVHEREVYWLLRKKFSESGISGALIEKTLGMPATFRNSSTVKKIVSKYS